MDFNHTDDRRMLAETINRFIRDQYGIEKRNEAAQSDAGFDREAWAQFAELGLIGGMFSEDDGGFGGQGFDLAVVFEELGRGLVVEPFLASAVLAGGLIAKLGKGAQRDLIEEIMAGSCLATLAHGEPDSRYDLEYIEATAKKSDDGWVLNGLKSAALYADTADTLIVSARTSGKAGDQDGISLFLVDPKAPGVALRVSPTVEGSRVADVRLSDVTVSADAMLGEEDQAFAALEEVVGRGVLALCAEALGAMETVKEQTLEYLRTRMQFGAPIGRFQALQHRMADLLLEIEQARSSVINAAAALDGDRLTREKALSAAKYQIGRIGRMVAEESIQMHGGIGMAWELAVPHFAKRLVMIDHYFGDTDHHLERFIELGRDAA